MKQSTVNKIIAFIAIIISICIAVRVWYDWENATDYWDGFAPNRVYNVFVCSVNGNESTIFAPLCENSGGDLHGTWKYDSTIWEVDKFISYYINAKQSQVNEYWKVRLENNVIVEVWRE